MHQEVDLRQPRATGERRLETTRCLLSTLGFVCVFDALQDINSILRLCYLQSTTLLLSLFTISVVMVQARSRPLSAVSRPRSAVSRSNSAAGQPYPDDGLSEENKSRGVQGVRVSRIRRAAQIAPPQKPKTTMHSRSAAYFVASTNRYYGH